MAQKPGQRYEISLYFVETRDPATGARGFTGQVSDTTLLPGYIVDFTFNNDGTVTGFGLRANGVSPQPAVTARLLRQIPFGELEKLARRQLSVQRDSVETHLARGGGSSVTRDYLEALTRMSQRPGRAGHHDVEYARIAQLYADAIRAGSARPNADLAEQLHFSRSRITQMVHEARRRGLLTEPPKGRPGGDLTAKARQLLEDDNGQR